MIRCHRAHTPYHSAFVLKILAASGLFVAVASSRSCMTAAALDRPNIVIILADDLGWGSLGCYGADPALIRTPHCDRLAREGRRFTDANSPSSVCSPTRYGLRLAGIAGEPR
jgi:arylsulfatase A